jgi:hypothetical protein
LIDGSAGVKVKKRFWKWAIAPPLLLATLLFLICVFTPKPRVCCDFGDTESDPATWQTHAAAVIVRPWRGAHHVFGIFVLPDRFQPGNSGRLTIQGTNFEKNERIFYRGTRKSGVQAPPGYYVIKVYVRTRAALGLMLQGKLGKLNHPCNWVLRYSPLGDD